MPRVATGSIREHLDDALLSELVRVCVRPVEPAFVEAAAPADDADLEPFADWDAHRGHGRGFFLGDRRECATRRVDLRGPTDLDPGPLPMEEAPADVTGSAWHLTFAG